MINVEIKGLKEIKAFLDPKKMEKVTRSAIDTTATASRKEAETRAAKTYNIKKGRIQKDSTGTRTTSLYRTRPGNLKATVTYRGKRPGLQHFGPNKAMVNRKRSTRFRRRKDQTLKLIERG